MLCPYLRRSPKPVPRIVMAGFTKIAGWFMLCMTFITIQIQAIM